MVLGVTCSNTLAYLTAVDDGQAVAAPVYRIEVASLSEASAELEATLEEIGRALSQITPERIVLLLPEQTPRFKHTHAELAPRVTLETLFRLAAVRAEIPIDLMPRPTLRSTLGLPQTGDLASHTGERLDTPVGPYWNAGRNIAGLAALAGEAG